MTAASPLESRQGQIALGVWYGLVVLFLFAPIVTSIVYSFNLGTLGKQTSTFTGWTAQWFADAWNNVSLRRAIGVSLVASLWSAIVAVILGTCLGVALVCAISYVPVLQSVFRTVPLSPADWALITVLGALPLAGDEIRKAVLRRRAAASSQGGVS